VPIAPTRDAFESRTGIHIVPERRPAAWPSTKLHVRVGARPAVDALDDALNQITVRYGIDTSRFVAMHLEYTRQAGL
jgi:hypothetical protein